MKANKSGPTVKVLMHIKEWGFNINTGKTTALPPNLEGKELALVHLKGICQPPDVIFSIRVHPDGSKIPEAKYDEAKKIVEMGISWCQLAPLIELISNSDAAHALFRVDEGQVHADVHGEFYKKT